MFNPIFFTSHLHIYYFKNQRVLEFFSLQIKMFNPTKKKKITTKKFKNSKFILVQNKFGS
jgi:hypothetical protein